MCSNLRLLRLERQARNDANLVLLAIDLSYDTEISQIITVEDEAHRSQYDQMALNMRNALPKAAFIGFTGTPLMAGEERTRQVFGEYVSVYNFKQSIDDNATVPLYYENRIPELELTNEDLNEDIENVGEAAMLEKRSVTLQRNCRKRN